MAELSDFQRKFIFSGEGVKVTLFTQKEFDEALTKAKAEIMAIAIHTTKQAIAIERQACAEVVQALSEEMDEGVVAVALRNAAIAVANRRSGPVIQ